MQVLVLIVQNAVPYSELGVATSGATFFRSIGGSFGTAIFGAIFSNVLVGNLATAPRRRQAADRAVELRASHRRSSTSCPRRSTTASSPAYAESIQTVFIIAAPIGLVAFFASWLIPHIELRRAVARPCVPPTRVTAPSPAEPAT